MKGWVYSLMEQSNLFKPYSNIISLSQLALRAIVKGECHKNTLDGHTSRYTVL